MMEIAIDALVLVALLQLIDDDEIGYLSAFLVALAASIGTTILAVGLFMLIGIAGIVVAAIMASALLGVAVSALFGVEIKKSFLIGGVFMIVHIGVSRVRQLIFRAWLGITASRASHTSRGTQEHLVRDAGSPTDPTRRRQRLTGVRAA